MSATPILSGEDINVAASATRGVLAGFLHEAGISFETWVVLRNVAAADEPTSRDELARRLAALPGFEVVETPSAERLLDDVVIGTGAAEREIGPSGQRRQHRNAQSRGERIDIVPWSQDTSVFVSRSLAPAKVMDVKVKEAEKRMVVVVADDQLSLITCA